ncbi:sugar phosphate isomerase/epimerase [Paenibacillus spongiae]|uniref:Sugar phosphate isomerase/epimerase n=1 Tax=Paenibacillus spongiae TaxID=2909671 RepID=A0ABY5S2D1_9BACL|nr:sugar phosphate isomerase/epimerase [Paenibacillus spongiae]UVI28022.1 sugar phosphate isomerase/epimerase [Paenibacillus spongiae]
MNRFLIGQYGMFDDKKYKRDFKRAFYGIEACLFEREEDFNKLIRESEAHSFQIGIHFPLRAGRAPLRDALFLSQDEAVREAAFELVHQELAYLAAAKPAYILFHYPKPVLLDHRVDWSAWRFADPAEYVYDTDYTYAEFTEKSDRLFQWLSDRSQEYDFVPVLEFDALHEYVYRTNLLEELLAKYPRIKLCLDTGRLFLQDKCDPFFDARHVIRKFARYAEVIHLWNLQFTDRIEHYHYPVLPEQSPEEGWAPIEAYLTIIREENNHVKIQFEHRSDLIRDDDLERCYAWVDQLLSRS